MFILEMRKLKETVWGNWFGIGQYKTGHDGAAALKQNVLLDITLKRTNNEYRLRYVP